MRLRRLSAAGMDAVFLCLNAAAGGYVSISGGNLRAAWPAFSDGILEFIIIEFLICSVGITGWKLPAKMRGASVHPNGYPRMQ